MHTSDVRTRAEWVRIVRTETTASVMANRVVMVDHLACGHTLRLPRSVWLIRGAAGTRWRRCPTCQAALDPTRPAPAPPEVNRRTGPKVVLCRIQSTVRTPGTSNRGGEVCVDHLACGHTVQRGGYAWAHYSQGKRVNPTWRRCDACGQQTFGPGQ